MNDDFGTTLTALLDDVAGSIEPHGDIEAVFTSQVPAPLTVVGGAARPFRRGLVAAAALLVLGGGAAAAAFHGFDSGPDAIATAPSTGRDMPAPTTTHDVERATPTVPEATPTTIVTTEEEPAPSTEPAPTTEAASAVARTAALGDSRLTAEPPKQQFVGTAPAGETITISTPYGTASAVADADGRWAESVTLREVPAGSTVGARITFSGGAEVVELAFTMPAAPTTEPQPVPVAFTAEPGEGGWAATPMWQRFHGTATAGSKILASTSFGAADAVANEQGTWELKLVMREVPAGTGVRVVVTSSTSSQQFEFWLQRPAAPPPATIPFTASLGGGEVGPAEMHQTVKGTGQPGSAVVATSPYGAGDTTVAASGEWSIRLHMFGVPGDVTIPIHVTNSASPSVYDFSVFHPAATPVDFTANAAFTECDSTPPFNEYWGRSTAGAVITISSPYGSTQVTSNGDGNWSARLEFPDAPVGETFVVRVTSSKATKAYELPMKRIAPV